MKEFNGGGKQNSAAAEISGSLEDVQKVLIRKAG